MRRRPPACDSELPSLSAGPRSIARATSAQVSLRTRSASRRDSSPSFALRKSAVQHVGDDEAEHVIAEKFQPLIAGRAIAARQRGNVRERAFEQVLVGKFIADPALRAPSCPWPCGSSDDREQPAPAHRHRPAPELPGALALEDGEENDLRLADDILERHHADLAEAAVGRIVAVVAHHEIMIRPAPCRPGCCRQSRYRPDRACSSSRRSAVFPSSA